MNDSQPHADARPTLIHYIVLAAFCMVAIIAYVQRNSISVAEEAIRTDLGLTKEQSGLVISTFFLTYALFQIPTGLMAKVLGSRRALTILTHLYSAGAAVFAVAGGWPLLCGSRLFMGATQSGIFPCAVVSISRWIPSSWRSLANGLLSSCMSIGGALGGVLTGLLLPVIGWRWTFGLFSIPGFLFALWFFWWFRDRPEEHPGVNTAELELLPGGSGSHGTLGSGANAALSAEVAEENVTPEVNEPTPWGEIFSSLAIWSLCGQQFFRAAGYIFFASWFTTFLRETRGVADVEAGILTSLPLLAVVAGAPLGGILSDWIMDKTGSIRASRQGLAALSMLACSVLIVASYPIHNAWLAVLVISAGSFVASFGGPCAYTASIDMGGRHVAMVFSVMNTAGNVGAFIFPIVVPLLLNEGDEPGSGNWTTVLFLFAGLYLAAAVCFLLADVRKVIRGDVS